MADQGKLVSIVMIEDDEGHARLIERNIRRAGVTNEITHFLNGTMRWPCCSVRRVRRSECGKALARPARPQPARYVRDSAFSSV